MDRVEIFKSARTLLELANSTTSEGPIIIFVFVRAENASDKAVSTTSAAIPRSDESISDGEPMLRIRDLRAGYGELMVLTGFGITLEPRQIVAILGRNGIGKTTLVKTLAGLIKTRGGRITLEDDDITDMSPPQRARLGLGYVPQGREIFSKLTVRENLLVGVRARKLPLSTIDETLETFPTLRPKLNDLGSSLSGGQQQLLALARALALRPKLLLLDEPSEGIQPSLLDEIRQHLVDARKRYGEISPD